MLLPLLLADHGELARRPLLQDLPRRQLDLSLQAGADLTRRGRGDDEHAAPVLRVRDPVGVAAALQPVELNVGVIVRTMEDTGTFVECFDAATNTCVVTPNCGLRHVLESVSKLMLTVPVCGS